MGDGLLEIRNEIGITVAFACSVHEIVLSLQHFRQITHRCRQLNFIDSIKQFLLVQLTELTTLKVIRNQLEIIGRLVGCHNLSYLVLAMFQQHTVGIVATHTERIVQEKTHIRGIGRSLRLLVGVYFPKKQHFSATLVR